MLSKYSASHKNSINRMQMSIKKKARLRIANKTRWSSEFLVLISHHKAYKRGVFTDLHPCPVKMEALEIYIQILMPAFTFNLVMQRTYSSICDVLPALTIMLSKWSRMKVPDKYRDLCKNLIAAFKHKFKEEMSSPIYAVAAFINTAKLSKWQTRSDCAYFRSRAIGSLTAVAKSFLMTQKDHQEDPVIPRTVSAASSIDSMNCLLDDDNYLSETEIGN